MQDVPNDIERRLEELEVRQLEQVSQLVDRLVEAQRREQRIADDEDVTVDKHGDPLPDGVPAKATLTVKTIKNNDYWYWQWRTPDGIVTSQYKGPANRG